MGKTARPAAVSAAGPEEVIREVAAIPRSRRPTATYGQAAEEEDIPAMGILAETRSAPPAVLPGLEGSLWASRLVPVYKEERAGPL
jgi:hypothetical protein